MKVAAFQSSVDLKWSWQTEGSTVTDGQTLHIISVVTCPLTGQTLSLGSYLRFSK